MARVTPAQVRASAAGAAISLTAPIADGDAIQPGSALLVNNTDGTTLTVTIVTGGTVGSGLAIADVAITVPATSMRLIKIETDRYFQQGSGTTAGLVHVDYSRVTGVTRAVVGLGL